jgi:hypothetical protein
MNRNIRNTYVKTQVQLDNNSFEDCIFRECILEYSGTGPVGLTHSTFLNCQWTFTGAASNTLIFMRSIYHGLGEEGARIVDGTFELIRLPFQNDPPSNSNERSTATTK